MSRHVINTFFFFKCTICIKCDVCCALRPPCESIYVQALSKNASCQSRHLNMIILTSPLCRRVLQWRGNSSPSILCQTKHLWDKPSQTFICTDSAGSVQTSVIIVHTQMRKRMCVDTWVPTLLNHFQQKFLPKHDHLGLGFSTTCKFKRLHREQTV